jgi:hypothetical protein
MTRRALLRLGPALPALAASAPSAEQIIVPVRRVLNRRARLRPEALRHFQELIWPEAVADFARCGVRLSWKDAGGDISGWEGREPVISGLERRALNLAITDRIPTQWDGGRALAGVTTLYRGFHLCMAAVEQAHPHRAPLVGVNTCVHELLHAFLGDIFERRPPGFRGQLREFRVDLHATRLWLLGDGATIRASTAAYLQRLRAGG